MINKNKFILYIVIIITILSVVFGVYFNNNKTDKNVIEFTKKNVEEYKNYMKNINQENTFPKVNLNKNEISKKDYTYLSNNFTNLNYNINKNKNVGFSVFIPLYFNNKIKLIIDSDPFKLTDNRNYILLSEINDSDNKINGKIYAFNTELEIDPNSLNTLLFIETLKFEPVMIDYKQYINGTTSDIVFNNPNNGEITRSKVIRHSSLYYILSFTFKNFYHYEKYAKDISIMFNSFIPTYFSSKISNIDFDLVKIKNYDLLYPKNWNIKTEYNKEKKLDKINISNKNNNTIFTVNIYENNNKSLQEIINEYLNIIRGKNFSFDKIDENISIYDDNNKSYLLFLKNAKFKDNIPVTIAIKINIKHNGLLVAIMCTSKTEKKSYIYYKQDERIFDVLLTSLNFRFLYNTKIEDTDWIKLYYKYNHK